MRIEQHLAAITSEAFARALGLSEPTPSILRAPNDPGFGDYQLNGAMAVAKRLKKPPREVAEEVLPALLELEAIASAEVAGPGFINLRLHVGWIGKQLTAALADANEGVPRAEAPQKIVVDFSSPNIAKEMHVGHIRSTIIGDALVRMLRFIGHEVMSDNHLGDWGTQFGLLIVGMRTFGSEEALAQNAIAELERVYKLANAKAKEDQAFADSARAELAKLQRGDPENRALWERFVATTRKRLDEVYAMLGVTFDVWLGESAYDAALPGVVQLLLDKGIAVESDGAICVFFEKLEGAPKELKKQKEPYIIRKRDGAFLYATSDIACIFHRRDHFKTDRAIYVVDARQSHHFKQLFAVAAALGVTMRLEHVGFGMVLGEDGKPLKAREGKAITLASLLEEAIERAGQYIATMELKIPPEDVPMTNRAVGIGAVKFADLQQNRTSDYQFDWEKMISIKGKAGPYLQYAYARTRSIFSNAGAEPAATAIHLVEPTELALGKALLPFADVVHRAAEECLPHLLCDHLYEVARAFSSFYEKCRVLDAEPAVRSSRLALTLLTSRQLGRGLSLLGIERLERM